MHTSTSENEEPANNQECHQFCMPSISLQKRAFTNYSHESICERCLLAVSSMMCRVSVWRVVARSLHSFMTTVCLVSHVLARPRIQLSLPRNDLIAQSSSHHFHSSPANLLLHHELNELVVYILRQPLFPLPLEPGGKHSQSIRPSPS